MGITRGQRLAGYGVAALVIAAMVLLLGVQTTDAQSPAPPKPAAPVADPPPPENPTPEADDPTLRRNGRRNINPSYAKNLAMVRVTDDFRLQRPNRRMPDGITGEEAVKVSETLAGGIRLLRSMQDSEGAIDTHSGDITGSHRPHLSGNHALSLWVLLACGISVEDPVIKRGAETLVEFATKGLGGLDRPLDSKDRIGGGAYQEPREKNPQSFDKLDTEELHHILCALEALAHARLNESEVKVEKHAEDEPATAVDGGIMPLVMRRRTIPELRQRLSKKESDCAKGAVEALMKRYDEKENGWREHINAIKTDPESTCLAALGLLSATRYGAWTPKKAMVDAVGKSMWIDVDKDKRPCRKHTLQFLQLSAPSAPGKADVMSVVSVEFNCRSWQGTFRRDRGLFSPSFRELAGALAIRRMMIGSTASTRGGNRTKELDTAICENLAALARYLPPTGPSAKDTALPEEQDQQFPIPPITDYKDPYDRVFHSGFPHYRGDANFTLARVGLMLGNDTIGSCEWFPDLMRNTIERLDHVRYFKEAQVPENEDDDAKAERLKAKDQLRRKFGPLRCKELLMLALTLDKVPVWVPGE